MRDVLAEHREVVEAVASGNPQYAVTAMRSHLDHVLPLLEMTRKLRPEYFMPKLATRLKR